MFDMFFSVRFELTTPIHLPGALPLNYEKIRGVIDKKKLIFFSTDSKVFFKFF